jgi:hypothetical protein
VLLRLRQLCHDQVPFLLGLHVFFTVHFFCETVTQGPALFGPSAPFPWVWAVEHCLIAAYAGYMFNVLLEFRGDMRRSKLGRLWLIVIYGWNHRPLI